MDRLEQAAATAALIAIPTRRASKHRKDEKADKLAPRWRDYFSLAEDERNALLIMAGIVGLLAALVVGVVIVL
jgi:hypothetical protein